jgi:Ca2+-binding EF-hand superfamily protein
MKIIVWGAVAALAAAIPALAQTGAEIRGPGATRADVQARIARIFAATDANRDGFVTQAEAAARAPQRSARGPQAGGQANRQARLDARFAALDTDRNGSISRAEFDAQRAGGREKRAERRGDRMERRGNRGIAMRPRMFERIDANKDGRLSLAEAVARPLERFTRADANNDGTLTREERRAAREKMRMQRQGRRDG